MADTGWITVGTGANDGSFGTGPWTNPGNATADDATYVTINNPLGGDANSYYLKGTNLGLSIPASASIDGIEVRFEGREGVGDAVATQRIRIVKADGTIGATDRAGSEAWTTSDAFYSYGGAADLWGESWAPADVNDVDFGFVMSANVSASGGDAFVDVMQVKVYYTVTDIVAVGIASETDSAPGPLSIADGVGLGIAGETGTAPAMLPADGVPIGLAAGTDSALPIKGRVARPDHFEVASIAVLELDIDVCGNVYGVAPCTAAGAPGSECYNCFKTCQDKPNFTRSTKTWRFCTAGAPVPAGEQIRPYLDRISFAPTEIDIERGLAPRAKATAVLVDDPCSDAEADPYYATRAAEAQGSFWPRFQARNPNAVGRWARIRYGWLADGIWNWDDFSDEWYIIESVKGPDARGAVQVVLKDPIKLADRRQIPEASAGKLAADIDAVVTTIPLDAGSGAGYDATGWVRIGDEVIAYAAVAGDDLTGCSRGQFGTIAAAAEADDSVQQCRVWQDAPAWQVLRDLLLDSGLPSANIASAEFELEYDKWLGVGYDATACLSVPEDISKHLVELLVQVGGYMWWDPVEQAARFKVLAPASLGDTVESLTDEANVIEGSVAVDMLDDLRTTLRGVVYDLRSATADRRELSSYRATVLAVDLDAESTNEYGDRRSSVATSRWFTRANAAAVTTQVVRRTAWYRDAAVRIDVKLDAKDAGIRLADQVDLTIAQIAGVDGAPETVRAIVVKRQVVDGGLKLGLRLTRFTARWAIIAPDGAGDYPADMEYLHIAPDENGFPDGTPAYVAF